MVCTLRRVDGLVEFVLLRQLHFLGIQGKVYRRRHVEYFVSTWRMMSTGNGIVEVFTLLTIALDVYT